MTNPDQWPSFTNLSVWYAEHATNNITRLSTVPVVFLQRLWRQRHLAHQDQKLCPIQVGRWATRYATASRSFFRNEKIQFSAGHS
jgi:hypothetical protein